MRPGRSVVTVLAVIAFFVAAFLIVPFEYIATLKSTSDAHLVKLFGGKAKGGEGVIDIDSTQPYNAENTTAWDPYDLRFSGGDYATIPPTCQLGIHRRNARVHEDWAPELENFRPGIKPVKWSVADRDDGKEVLCYSDPQPGKNCAAPVYSNGIGYHDLREWNQTFHGQSDEDRTVGQLKRLANGLQKRLWYPKLDRLLCERADENRYIHIAIATYNPLKVSNRQKKGHARRVVHDSIIHNWITNMDRLGIHNWIMFVGDDEMVKEVESLGGAAINGMDYNHFWPRCSLDTAGGMDVTFNLEIIKRGYHVIYSNVDVVWFRDYPQQYRHQDFAFTTYSAADTERAALADPNKRRGAELLFGPGQNFGHWYMRSTPQTVRVYFMVGILTLGYFGSGLPRCHDNQSWNELIRYHHNTLVSPVHYENTTWHLSPPDDPDAETRPSYRVLSPLIFPNAQSFVRGNMARHPVSLHMTGYGPFGKSWYLREQGLWVGSPPDYFREKYVMYKWSNPAWNEQEAREALISAMIIAALLDRALILPSFLCEFSGHIKDHPLNPEFPVKWCPFDFFYDYKFITQNFMVRENTFFHSKELDYARMTHAVVCDNNRKDCNATNDEDSSGAYWQFRNATAYLMGDPIAVDGRDVSQPLAIPGPTTALSEFPVHPTLTEKTTIELIAQVDKFDIVHLGPGVHIEIDADNPLVVLANEVLIPKDRQHGCC